MANPDILVAATVRQDILVEAQLASGNNDFVVPTGHAWTIRSFLMCNVSGAPVTVTVSVLKSGGTARTVVPAEVIAAGDGLAIDAQLLVATLPEQATLRINSTAATAVDVLLTGMDTTA